MATKKIKKYKIMTAMVSGNGVPVLDTFEAEVGRFVNDHNARDVQWITSSGVHGGSWLSTFITAVIVYEEDIEIKA